MIKKLLKISLVFLLLFSFASCNKNTNEENNTKEETKETTTSKGKDLSLTETTSFDKLEIKYPHGATVISIITSLVISDKKEESDEDLYRIIFGSFYGTTTESAMEGYTKKGTKKYNNITWDVYEKNGEEFYAVCYEYTVDVVGFILNDDLGSFKEDVLKNIKLKN